MDVGAGAGGGLAGGVRVARIACRVSVFADRELKLCDRCLCAIRLRLVCGYLLKELGNGVEECVRKTRDAVLPSAS